MIKTYSFEDGKYKVERDTDTSFIKAVLRNDEQWPVMFDQVQHQKFFHAMLNRIDQLEAPLEAPTWPPGEGTPMRAPGGNSASAWQTRIDQERFRVWPDGTVQDVKDGDPYNHMSDDYQLIWAYTAEDALKFANGAP